MSLELQSEINDLSYETSVKIKMKFVGILFVLILSVSGLKASPESYNTSEICLMSALRMTTIPKNVCPGDNIRFIDLSRNNINYIEPYTFISKSLEELIMYGNKIIAINKFTFVGATALRILSLEQNRITSLHHDTFKYLTSLEELFLGHNQIKILEDHVYAGLRKLKKLNLEHNAIEHIHNNAFHGLHSLSELNLNHNNIAVLTSAIFTRFYKWDPLYFDFDSNQIEAISPETFNIFVRLHLSIKNNKCVDGTADETTIDTMLEQCYRYFELKKSGNTGEAIEEVEIFNDTIQSTSTEGSITTIAKAPKQQKCENIKKSKIVKLLDTLVKQAMTTVKEIKLELPEE